MFHDNWCGMPMMWFVWIPLIILVIIVLVRLLDNNNIFGNSRPKEQKESPLDILKRRYASGEITIEEFERQKEVLKKS